MNPQTPTDNTALFHQLTGSSPRYREEATTSWWLCAESRADFQAAAEREQPRMARSKGAMLARGIVVGHSVSGRKP